MNEQESNSLLVNCQNNLLLLRSVPNGKFQQRSNLSDRKRIKQFSTSSGSRMRRYLRCCRADYSVMLTLTYPFSFPVDGSESKEHLRKFIQELKRANSRDGVVREDRWSLFWFMEFQERGAFHYHIFINRRYDKKFVAELWYRIVGSEDERHLRAGTRIETIRSGRHGTVSYASKYAAKHEQKEIPDFLKNTGRFWGISGDRLAVAAATIVSRETMRARPISTLLNRLKDRLRAGINEDKARIMKKRETGTRIIFMRDQSFIQEINSLCMQIEALNAICSSSKPIYIMPHHEQDYLYAVTGYEEEKVLEMRRRNIGIDDIY